MNQEKLNFIGNFVIIIFILGFIAIMLTSVYLDYNQINIMPEECEKECKIFGMKYYKYKSGNFFSQDVCLCIDESNKPYNIWR